ncbi:right-handed parallel beta-helix repeat-containing protein [bacterium]|nr:right-handed parallel beta-helix repeat-containing protein [bacterium]
MIFRNWILENFPFIEDDFDALTDYELFCKVVGYMKKSLEKVEGFQKDIDEFTIKLNEFQNYFDNLDVQEEIDNKLEEMAESGELEQIIAEYLELNTIKVFNTVSDLVDGDNLSDGSYVRTMGFYSVGDNGGAEYKIRTATLSDTADGYTLISLTNFPNLVAEIIVSDILNAHQFGIFGDNLTDVTERLEKAMHYNLYLPAGTYLISNRVGINNHKLFGDGIGVTTIKLADNSTINTSGILRTDGVDGYILKDLTIDGNMDNITENYNNAIFYDSTNVLVENVEFTNGTNSMLKLNGSDGVIVKNCYFKNSTGVEGATAPAIYGQYIKNILISGCMCENIGDHFVYICADDLVSSSENITIENCILKTCGVDQLTGGSAICIYSNTKNVLINNCQILNSRSGINISNHDDVLVTPKDVLISNCLIRNCDLNGISVMGISGDRIDNVSINDTIIKENGQDGISIRQSNNIVVKNCNVYNNYRHGIETRANNHISIYNTICKNNSTSGITLGYSGNNSNNVRIYNTECYCDDENRTQNTGIYLNYGQNIYLSSCLVYDNTTYDINRRPGGATDVTIIDSLDPETTTKTTNSITFSDKIPTNCDHKVGDIIFYNTNNSSKVGAVCTSAGTPGTWREF